MRGRTNVGGGGIAINASVQNKTIKSGDIVAGDFVEYYTEANVISQSASNEFICNIGSYTITKKNASLALFKNKEQVDSFIDYNILCACQYNNFVIFFSSSNVLGVIAIDTTNDEFSLVDTITASVYDSSFDDAYSIGARNDKIIVCTKYYYNTSETRYRFALVDISVTGELSNGIITNYITKNLNFFNIKIDSFENASFYFLGSASSTLYCIELIINQDRTISWGNSNTIRNYFTLGSKIFQQDSIVVYDGYNNTNSEVPIYIDLSNGIGNLINILGEVITNIEDLKFVTYEESSNLHYLHLYSFNTSTYEAILLDTISIDQPYLSGTTNAIVNGFANGNDVLAKITGGYNLRIFEINGDFLQEIPDIDYVIPYSGSGRSIGIAKDNGTTDDVIGVYIPLAIV